MAGRKMIAQRFSAGYAVIVESSPFRDGTKSAGLQSRRGNGDALFVFFPQSADVSTTGLTAAKLLGRKWLRPAATL